MGLGARQYVQPSNCWGSQRFRTRWAWPMVGPSFLDGSMARECAQPPHLRRGGWREWKKYWNQNPAKKALFWTYFDMVLIWFWDMVVIGDTLWIWGYDLDMVRGYDSSMVLDVSLIWFGNGAAFSGFPMGWLGKRKQKQPWDRLSRGI
jgi:hypothetical protein